MDILFLRPSGAILNHYKGYQAFQAIPHL